MSRLCASLPCRRSTVSARSAATAIAEFGGLVLDRVEPMRIVARIFKQPVARAQRTLERRDAAAMFGIDRDHQTVEKTPPLGAGPGEQSVHRRRQPDDAQMIGEGGGRGDRLAIDPALPRGGGLALMRRLDAGAERRKTERAFDLDRHRPGAVALAEGDFFERCAAQAAAGHEKRNRFERLVLPAPFGPTSTTMSRAISSFAAR